MNRYLIVYVSAVILTASVNVSSCAAGTGYDPKPPGTPVKIFRQYQPECDYKRLGKVTNSDGDVLKDAARAMGGDALIITETVLKRSGQAGVTGYERITMVGIAIAFTNPACTE